MNMILWKGVSHVLLDIEGTTCPVSYVAEILFPYASANLAPFLENHQQEAGIRALIQELETLWLEDTDQEARDLLGRSRESAELSGGGGILTYLKLLIRRDRKVTALKDLQGKIWAEGYARGELIGPLFDDVPTSLRRWQQEGLVLAVYSSGSISAQQLIYQHSNHGDLRYLFSHWYDTHTGSKHDPRSYTLIAETMGCAPQAILFVSDSDSELQAASQSGLQVVCSQRKTDKVTGLSTNYPTINDFHEILFELQHAQA
jgi:enolase-phosphatase E1